MAVDVKTIACQQCGSLDVKMLSETQGVCNVCGAKFILQQNSAFNEVQIHEASENKNADRYLKAKIKPEHSIEKFLRAVWIESAKADIPVDAFSEDFTITQEKTQMVCDSGVFDVEYTASVGYDRKEPYIDYENYTESVPYTDSNGHTYTKSVTKQRQVTKYRDVTDWKVATGSLNVESFATVDNKYEMPHDHTDKEFSKHLRRFEYFRNNLENVKKESISLLSADEANSLHVSANAKELIDFCHGVNIEVKVSMKLPGDHKKDISYGIKKINNHKTEIYTVPEYFAEIKYKGDTYTLRALPIGDMRVFGECIKNEDSMFEFEKRSKEALNTKTVEIKSSIDKNIWEKTKWFSYISTGLMAFSIIVSLIIRVPALVIIAFLAAMAMHIYTNLTIKKVSRAERDKGDNEIKSETNRVNKEIAEYAEKHKAKMKECLDNKLLSLGLKAVTAEEL